MTRAPLWFHFVGWLVLVVALTMAMIITASADEVIVCDQDIPVPIRLLSSPPKDGYKLQRQYYDERTRQWIAEFTNDSGSTIIVRQTFGEAMDSEWRQ